MICIDLYRDRFECDGIIVHCAVWCDMIPDCDYGFDKAHCLLPVRDTEPPKPDDCKGDGKLFIQTNCVIMYRPIMKLREGNVFTGVCHGGEYSPLRTHGIRSTQVWIQDLVKGGPQLLRPKIADIAKRSHTSEVSILRLGSRACLRALEAFGFLMLKYAFSHILETLFLLFLTSILTPKVDKNRALDFTSINLRHSDMLHLFFNLHEKVML